MIDRSNIINKLSKMQVLSNEDGLIPAFGVLVNRFPSSIWNRFSFKILGAAGDDLYDEASGLLENAASECGYHTGNGIINSQEFLSIVGDKDLTPEDKIHALYAIVTAFGWADADVIELIPNEKLVVRAKNYYESDIITAFRPTHPFAYMLRGISRAFMDIVYGESYPSGFGTFKCVQTKGLELGDDYGEFIVTKAE